MSGTAHSMPLPADAAFYREMCVHDAFRMSRTSAVEEGVYGSVFAALDEYCDPRQAEERKPPFVLEGGPGSGKSTVLALWAQRRREHGDASKLREVLVYHHAGASAESTRLSLMLYRLSAMLQQVCELSDLKVGGRTARRAAGAACSTPITSPPLSSPTAQLDEPDDEEQQRRALMRFVDAAVKRPPPATGGASARDRRPVIVIVDNVHCVRTDDGSEGLPLWLPMDLPRGALGSAALL